MEEASKDKIDIQWNDGKIVPPAPTESQIPNFRFNDEEWQKMYPNHSVDLRSDESKNEKDYYLFTNEQEVSSFVFWTSEGDGSTLQKQIEAIDDSEFVNLAKKKATEWRNMIAEAWEYLGIDMDS